jgi:trehalose synthase-fused probable maltokinase
MTQEQRSNSLAAAIRESLPDVLPRFLIRQRWFGGKARTIASAQVLDVILVPAGQRTAFVVLARISYAEGSDEVYVLPLLESEAVSPPRAREEADSILNLKFRGEEAAFHDAFLDREFSVALYEAIRQERAFKGTAGELAAYPTQKFRQSSEAHGSIPEPSLMKAEQSNTSVRFGERFILKFFRRLEQGLNPDLEIGTFLTDQTSFQHTPPMRGRLEYRRPQATASALGIFQDFVSNQGDAWRFTIGSVERFLEKVATGDNVRQPFLPEPPISESALLEIPAEVPEMIGSFWDSSGLLGRRTGELHVALASDPADPAFRPEPFSEAIQQFQFDSMRSLALQVLRVLEKRRATLPDSIRAEATRLLELEKDLLARFESFASQKMTGECIRIHGDYHLGQVLYTGSDFVIIDFEGEPARPLEERRRKRSPLQDVAGMLRSFHYAAYTTLYNRESKTDSPLREDHKLRRWTEYWQAWISVRFLKEYLSAAAEARFLPAAEDEFTVLLEAYLLEKAVYELGYELNNRPDWVRLPIQGILQLMEPRT